MAQACLLLFPTVACNITVRGKAMFTIFYDHSTWAHPSHRKLGAQWGQRRPLGPAGVSVLWPGHHLGRSSCLRPGQDSYKAALLCSEGARWLMVCQRHFG